MNSPDYMRDTIRGRVLNGALPASGPGKVGEGSSSTDKLCDGCEHPIFALHNRYEIELPATASDRQRLSMHRECYLAWLRFSTTLLLQSSGDDPRP
jgi:hypothetical protein